MKLEAGSYTAHALPVWTHAPSHPTPTAPPLQPGSTVATSLTEGEARDKHAFLLRVRGSQFKVEPQPLR